MLGRLLGLIKKEFLVIWKDPRSRMVVIVPPLVQLFVFSYAASYDLNHVALAVYDADRTPASRELIARFAGSPTFGPVLHLDDPGEIPELIDRRRVGLVLRIEPGFARALLLDPPAKAQLIVDGRQSNTALTILNYAERVIEAHNAELTAARGQPAAPASLVVRAWYNPNLESRWFIVPGLVALLSFVVTLTVTALSVAREREMGTFEQLLVTPLRPAEILIGKTVPPLVIGFGEASVIVLVAVLWFAVPLRGELWVLYLGLFLFLLAVIGVGIMISALSRTQQQAILGGFLFAVPAVLLSGFATPIANMPEAIQTLTRLNPLRYFLILVRGVFLRDPPLALLLHQLWPMALIALIALAAASWLFRHRLG